MAERIYLNNGWKFQEVFETAMTESGFDPRKCRRFEYLIPVKENTAALFYKHVYQMVSGYRKMLFYSKEMARKDAAAYA